MLGAGGTDASAGVGVVESIEEGVIDVLATETAVGVDPNWVVKVIGMNWPEGVGVAQEQFTTLDTSSCAKPSLIKEVQLKCANCNFSSNLHPAKITLTITKI